MLGPELESCKGKFIAHLSAKGGARSTFYKAGLDDIIETCPKVSPCHSKKAGLIDTYRRACIPHNCSKRNTIYIIPDNS